MSEERGHARSDAQTSRTVAVEPDAGVSCPNCKGGGPFFLIKFPKAKCLRAHCAHCHTTQTIWFDA